jgi:membrane-associated protein
MLENTALLGLALPGGTLVLLGAVYAQQGMLSLPGVLLLGWAGMVAGTSIDYAVGRWGLQRLLAHPTLARRVGPGLATAERHLARYGMATFLFAHLIGHIRSFVAITAGTTRLPYRRFLLYEGTAALLWNLLFVGAGYLLGDNLDRLQSILNRAGLAAAAVVVVLLAGYWLLRRRRATTVADSKHEDLRTGTWD